ncbi:hypothetical protein L1987_22952 [Smallanthus sonchifolius]|uniref:Uncharacterized protein n=1 Tax=Smallanthus sonchifolius TaxID=185202 RepID=A0ACB9IGV4_9ASTR|nr:hypothetical protein L1987_22952 [Smallanthus sonchifolius]
MTQYVGKHKLIEVYIKHKKSNIDMNEEWVGGGEQQEEHGEEGDDEAAHIDHDDFESGTNSENDNPRRRALRRLRRERQRDLVGISERQTVTFYVVSDGTRINRNSIGLQLSYPESPVHFSENPDFMFEDLTTDFLERGGGGRDYDGGDYFPSMVATGGYGADTGNIHGPGPFGEMMSYYEEHYEKLINGDDVKPKVDQTGCHSDLHGSGVGRNGSSGYLLGLGSSWAGLINRYGSSSANPPLV